MDMQWLDDVLVLLEEGNMTRAAARRNITQPAFSRRIRNFEDWLGVTVLDRGANKIEISPALASNEVEIRALVSRLQELRAMIVNFDAASSTISVAAQHAPVFSTFPDMTLQAKRLFPSIRFRLFAGDLDACVTRFLRGDANMLLCYESESMIPLRFGVSIRRVLWGVDYVVPVVGGSLRYAVEDGTTIAQDTPAIVYPENSFFGEVLNNEARTFGTQRYSKNPVCETTFSSGIKELALKGIGVAWLPTSMVHKELESGQLMSLSKGFGTVKLEAAVYADVEDNLSVLLLDTWRSERG